MNEKEAKKENLSRQEQIEQEEKIRVEARTKAEKEIKEKEKSKKQKQTGMGCLVLLGIVVVWIIISMVPAMKSDKEMRNKNDEIVAGLAEDTAYVTEAKTPERAIELKVIDALGYKTNMGEKRIREIKTYEEEKEVTISFAANENLTTNLTKYSMLTDIKNLLEKLPPVLTPKINSILFDIYLKLVDKYGEESMVRVMLVTIKKDTWEKINWDNFFTDNIPNVAATYWEHPVLKK